MHFFGAAALTGVLAYGTEGERASREGGGLLGHLSVSLKGQRCCGRQGLLILNKII